MSNIFTNPIFIIICVISIIVLVICTTMNNSATTSFKSQNGALVCPTPICPTPICPTSPSSIEKYVQDPKLLSITFKIKASVRDPFLHYEEIFNSAIRKIREIISAYFVVPVENIYVYLIIGDFYTQTSGVRIENITLEQAKNIYNILIGPITGMTVLLNNLGNIEGSYTVGDITYPGKPYPGAFYNTIITVDTTLPPTTTTTSTSTSTTTTTAAPTTSTSTSTSTSTTTSSGAGTAYNITTAAETDMQACNEIDNNQTIYGNNTTWLTVTRFYTDSGMTTPFDGFNSWYNEYYAGATSYVYQIDNDGYVVSSFDCSTI